MPYKSKEDKRAHERRYYRDGLDLEKRRLWSRRAHVKHRYGISLEEYDRMYVEQGGVCAICGEVETAKSKNGAVSLLCVDHDHATDAVRSLLCRKCNALLGQAREDIEILARAIAYLERWKK